MPKIVKQLAHVWSVVTGRVPTYRRYQCTNPFCGDVPRSLTGSQVERLGADRTMPCRRCKGGHLVDIGAGA